MAWSEICQSLYICESEWQSPHFSDGTLAELEPAHIKIVIKTAVRSDINSFFLFIITSLGSMDNVYVDRA